MVPKFFLFLVAAALVSPPMPGSARAAQASDKEAQPRAASQAPPATAAQDEGPGDTKDTQSSAKEPERAPTSSSPDVSAPAPQPRLQSGTEDVALPPSPLPPRLDHKHQFGLDLGLGLGYRLIKPYGDIWCGQRSNDPDNPNEPFCSSMSPLFLDLGLSFGVTQSVELVAHTRVGLTKDPISERRPISLLGGVRLWVDATGAFKWALGLEAMLDFTKQDGSKQQRPTYGVPKQDSLDVGGRFYGQIQYDFLPYLGLYAQIGGLVGALRWLRVELEGTLGIQGRLPRF